MTGPLQVPQAFANIQSPASTGFLDDDFNYLAGLVLDTVAQLRETTPQTSGPPRLFLTNVAATVPGIGNWYWYNPNDTTSPDNGYSIIVSADGSRWYLAPSGVTPGDIRNFGAVLDGVTDCTAAMVAACAQSGLIVIPGPMALASASLAALPHNAIALISGTVIRCTKPGSIIVTGTTACNVFWSVNSDNLQFIDVFALGNGASSATTTTGYFWYNQATSGATRNLIDFRFVRGGLKNFAGLYWMYWDNTQGTQFYFARIRITDADFISQPGNAQGPTNINLTATIAGFSGSDSVSYFGIRDVQVKGCVADGTYIKTFVDCWTGVFRAQVTGNELANFGGDSSFTNDTGAYALLAYDHGHGATTTQPDKIDFSGNIIDGVRDCGIYVAGANRFKAQGNFILGQTSTANSALPKGAIACNQASVAAIDGNFIDNSYFGISVVVGSGDVATLTQNTITEGPANSTAILAQPSGTGSVGSITIDGVEIDTIASGATGVRFDSNSTIGLAIFALKNFHINDVNNGIEQFSSDSSTPALGSVHIGNGELTGQGNIGLQISSCSSSGTRICLENIVFNKPVAGCVVLDIHGSTGLTVRGITFNDMTSGSSFCWNGAGAHGQVANVQYNNVATARRFSSSSDLGCALPTWTGNDNDFVQNLAPTEAGSGGSMYVTLGWVWDYVAAAWKPCRSLTGN